MVVSHIQPELHYKLISTSKLIRTTPTIAVWGVATATALTLFALDVPLVRKDVLGKLPMVGRYFPANEVHTEEE
ncbi:uncharacterized protein BX663DRAFT_551690 [Cokeromyces recurvatus]|uniref:uncharacterized protein n=1 Tax=Cokeromyces recurvatus TaxID=90255 RepID=UPI002220DD7D|nr:uncharacterized protein BX663DRAFT_551690 [Cokeromyces recurvatus]KAI7903421.1 hypothetical protein BX663DRAFT_551690 [Cokeromyces recurvatus]